MVVGFGNVPVLSRRTPGLALRKTPSGEVAVMSQDQIKARADKTSERRFRKHRTDLILMARNEKTPPAKQASAFGVAGLTSVPLPILLAGLGVVGLMAHSLIK